MRKKLVKLFCIQTSKNRCEEYVDLWPFLDSVLDESFDELETHVVFQGAEPNANLISVIAKRSPLLKKLKLNFKFYSASRRSSQDRITLIHSLDGLDSLHHLTSLTLYHLAGSYSQSILAVIGENCSSLTHLRLVKTNDSIGKHDILAIMLGELLDHLVRPLEHLHEERPFLRYKEVEWFKDAALSRLRVPSEFLTSLCFTLRHLEVSEYAGRRNSNSAIQPEIVAFVLRHMPNLEVLENFTSTEKAVHLLHRETGEAERNLTGPIQLGFEQACRDAIYHRGLAQPKSREPVDRPSSTFSGALSLTKLEYVYLKSENIADVLRAIRLTCPRLRNVSFGEKTKEGLAPHPSKRALIDAEEHQQLELELSKWPKLEGVTFAKVSPANVHAILNVFNANLKELSFIECSEINLADLERCTQLQSLRISSTCSVGLYNNVHALSADTFLPNLNNFSCKICLGDKSSLFENKTSLNRLHIKCCHMDIKECIQHKWRSLESLQLQRCSGLVDMATVSFLVDQLVDLKELFLPHGLQNNDPNHLHQTLQKANKKPTPTIIKLKFYEDVRCDLDPKIRVYDNRPAYARKVMDSPPSHRSDESPIRSEHSSYDSDPVESVGEDYFDSE